MSVKTRNIIVGVPVYFAIILFSYLLFKVIIARHWPDFPIEGAQVWKFSAGTYMICTPVVDEDKIYIVAYDSCLYCLNKENGNVIWRYCDHNWLTRHLSANKYPCSPAIDDKYVYYGSCSFYPEAITSHIICLNKHTGELSWKTELLCPCSDVALSGEKLLVRSFSGLGCYNKKTGKFIWSTNYASTSKPTISNNIVFEYYATTLCALNLNNGSTIWCSPKPKSSVADPIIYRDKIFVGSDDHWLRVFDIKTGKQIWSYKTDSAIDRALNRKNELILFNTRFGIYCVDGNNLKLVWKKNGYKTGSVTSTIYKDYLIYMGAKPKNSLKRMMLVLHLHTGQTVYCSEIGVTSGERRPVISGDILYFGSDIGNLYDIDLKKILGE